MGNKINREKLYFLNKVLDKKQLKELISWVFRNYGVARAANMADKLKDIGFNFATKAGISLSIEDLRIPEKKQIILKETQAIIQETENVRFVFRPSLIYLRTYCSYKNS